MDRQKLCKRISAIAIALLATFPRAGAQEPAGIWAPRLVNPAFVTPGSSFTVELRGDSNWNPAEWKAYVANDLRDWPCQVKEASYGQINRSTEPGWLLTVTTPTDIPPELFNLELRHPIAGTMQSQRSVSVVVNFETDFYILHITDEHARDDKAKSADGYRSHDLVRWATPVVNLINPRFVLNTGDESYQYETVGTRKSGNQLPIYAEIKSNYTVPSLIVPGNHDVTMNSRVSIQDWELYMGQRSFVSRLGSFYVFSHDFSDPLLTGWARKQWEDSFTDPTIKYRLIGEHHNGTAAFLPAKTQPADLILIGHVHQTQVIQTTPYPILMTIAAHKNARAGFVEFKRTEQGWESPTPANWSNDDVLALVGDWGKPQVEAKYNQPNDGKATQNIVTITNNLSKTFSDGRVRFLLQSGTYTVTGGEKLAEYTYAEGSKTAVLVKVPIAANGTTLVTIYPAK